MFSIAPNVNLIKNIGFGDKATHTTDILSKQGFMETNSILPINHPKQIKIDEDADYFYFTNYWSPKIKKTFLSVVVSKLYSILPLIIIREYRKFKKLIFSQNEITH